MSNILKPTALKLYTLHLYIDTLFLQPMAKITLVEYTDLKCATNYQISYKLYRVNSHCVKAVSSLTIFYVSPIHIAAVTVNDS